jgi:type VI secretion system secreted protein VgrG
MRRLSLWFKSGEASLKVRSFSVHESLSQAFEIGVRALSPNAEIDLESLTGKPAAFHVFSGVQVDQAIPVRSWAGICSQAQLVHAETLGDSTYHLRIVPELWLLSQRRSHRLFHHQTLVDIVRTVLKERAIVPDERLTGKFPKHEIVTQYGETDLAFVERLLEWAGITYSFDFEGSTTKLVLCDAPQGVDSFRELPYVGRPEHEMVEYVTKVRLGYDVRPGRLTLRDHDFRRAPEQPVVAEAPVAAAPEDFLEQYRYRPGAFWVHAAGTAEPMADDKGVVRHDPADYGKVLAARELEAERRGRQRLRFESNSIEMYPGRTFTIADHPHPQTASKLLCSEYTMSGGSEEEWTFAGEAVPCATAYRPELRTPKPRVLGVQSALVVGPKGQEIHCDEHGRVRVQFHWDRDGQYDDKSSCWIRVSQTWAGAGFGTMLMPRVGQEVLVGFLDGDVDRPVIVGRVYNVTNKVPYTLPELAARSTWKSDSTPNATGFNEIMFDDRKGMELFYLQAQKNLQKLVKQHESERTGANRSIVVGHDRSEIVGAVDATLVGGRLVVQAVKPPSKEDLKLLAQGEPAITPRPTKVDMVDKRILLTTGEASVALDDANIKLEAKGDISIKAKRGDVVVRGKMVWVNTRSPAPIAAVEDLKPHQPKTVSVHAPVKKKKLEQKPEERKARPAEPPPPGPPRAEPPKTKECVFRKAEVHCQHDARKPNEKTGILEVVPAELDGDKITLNATVQPHCGDHPEWRISTPFGQKQEKAAQTSIRVRPWNVIEPTATIILRWLSRVTPKQYSAWVASCSGESRHYIIRAFPKDRLAIKWTAKKWEPALKLLDVVNKAVQAYFPKAEAKGLIGAGVSIEAQWTEWEDWRAFYKHVVNVGFDPLIELTLRVPFGPTAAIPQWVKKWVGDITFFVEFFGQITMTVSGGRDTPDKARIQGKLEGQIGGRLGGMVKASKVVEVECFGETAIKGSAVPHVDEDKGPFAELSLSWTGLIGTIKVMVWNGRLEKQFNLQIIDERVLKKGNWYFLGEKG